MTRPPRLAIAALAAAAALVAGCSASDDGRAGPVGAGPRPATSAAAGGGSATPSGRPPDSYRGATPGPLPSVPSPATFPQTLSAPHLRPGSDPSALPGPILIADKLNDRLLVVDPQGRIRWEFPRPGDLAPGQTFRIPDDAFFTSDGRYIIATQEDDFVVTLIDVAKHRIVYRYGKPGVHGTGPNRLWNPDDAMMLPRGRLWIPDIKNCRLLLVAPGAHRPYHVFGNGVCEHAPPREFGYPNGAFPMSNGHFLVTEIHHDWVDELSIAGAGRVGFATHPPGVLYPSDTNEIRPGRYLTVDYSDPGQIVVFDRTGKALWRFAPIGKDALDKPSLALPLPNGDVLANDDANHRVIVVDPRPNRIVWQYGVTGHAGRAPGYLDNPDGVDLAPPRSLLMRFARAMLRSFSEGR